MKRLMLFASILALAAGAVQAEVSARVGVIDSADWPDPALTASLTTDAGAWVLTFSGQRPWNDSSPAAQPMTGYHPMRVAIDTPRKLAFEASRPVGCCGVGIWGRVSSEDFGPFDYTSYGAGVSWVISP